MKREIKKVALYIRKSREEETEDALNRQQSVLVEMCKKNSWEYEIFKEVGSSQDIEREQLQNMLDKIKLFEFDGVVVADLDRLSRSAIHFGIIKEVFMNFGCRAITLNKIYDFDVQEDDLFSDLQSILAKNEYQTIKKRLVRGVRQSAKDGNHVGKVPIGFEYNAKTKHLQLSVDAPVVRRIFDEYINGLSTKDIAYKFTFENVETSVGMMWNPAGIARILGNQKYLGDLTYGLTTEKNGKRGVKTNIEDRIIIEGTHESIVNKEEWDIVQKIKWDRNSKPIALGANKRMFSGLIKCKICGATHSFQTSKYKRRRISSCQTRVYKDDSDKYETCKNKGMNLLDFEYVFYRIVERKFNELSKFAELIRKENKNKVKKDYKNDIFTLEKNIKKLNQDVKRVQQGFVAQIFSEKEAQEQIKNYNMQIENATKQIEELKEIENDSTIDYVDKILEKMESFVQGKGILTEKEANRLLRELVGVIYYKRTDEFDNGQAYIDVEWKFEVSEDDVNESV